MSILDAFKKLIKKFKAPTHPQWRKFGQRVLNLSMAISVPPAMLGYHYWVLVIFLIGIIARGLVEFTEENANSN